MDSAVIAALAGALVGGVGTVGTTYLAGLNAGNREKRQRNHAFEVSRYEYAQKLLSEFISTWIATAVSSSSDPNDDELSDRLSTMGVKVQLIFPAIEKEVGEAVRFAISANNEEDPTTSTDPDDNPRGGKTDASKRRQYLLEHARTELKKLEPKA